MFVRRHFYRRIDTDDNDDVHAQLRELARQQRETAELVRDLARMVRDLSSSHTPR